MSSSVQLADGKCLIYGDFQQPDAQIIYCACTPLSRQLMVPCMWQWWPCDTVTLAPTTNIIISSCCYTGPGHAALGRDKLSCTLHNGRYLDTPHTALAGPKVRQVFSMGEQNASFILRFRYFEVGGSPPQLVSPAWCRRERDTDTHPICCPTRLIITVV